MQSKTSEHTVMVIIQDDVDDQEDGVIQDIFMVIKLKRPQQYCIIPLPLLNLQGSVQDTPVLPVQPSHTHTPCGHGAGFVSTLLCCNWFIV